MTLRCKVGDLAIIVESSAGNEGKIVRCVEYLGRQEQLTPGDGIEEGPVWRIDSVLRTWGGEYSNRIFDSQLRPIRDRPGDDEMLQIAGKPMEIVA